MIDLRLGDCLDILPTLEAESVDTVITDPPYGLEFMGKEWDHGVPGVRYWAQCLRVAKPGAMLCAFGGTRTHHRLMCAIEDAGWEIRDVLMWVFGSGFPKSHNIGKAIDKAVGAERVVVGPVVRLGDKKAYPTNEDRANHTGYSFGAGGSAYPTKGNITAPATDAAQLWDGWGTALKPAYEPIILAMKPLPGTFAQNALDYGVAGIWVDGTRVSTNGRPHIENAGGRRQNTECYGNGKNGSRSLGTTTQGRWPANLLLSHAPGCECVGVRKVKGSNGVRGASTRIYGGGKGFTAATGEQVGYASPDGTETIGDWKCVPGCPVRMLDEQSGESGPSIGIKPGLKGGGGRHEGWKREAHNAHPDYMAGYADTGGASRFFTRFHYSAKASRSQRELGLLGHIPCLKCGLLDSMTHMNAKTGKEEKCRRNGHPTVKPLDVCRWLCRLTRTPTGGVVLDPFMGSGRIPMAAILEGRDTIGIELERPSFEIAQAAVQWAEEQVPEMVQVRMAV